MRKLLSVQFGSATQRLLLKPDESFQGQTGYSNPAPSTTCDIKREPKNASRILEKITGFGSLILVIAASGWASSLAAESENNIAPSDQTVLSPGNVDMRSGYFQHQRVDAAIGPNENEDGLVLMRSHAPYDYSRTGINNLVWDGPFPMTHNWNIRLYENRVWLGVRGISSPTQSRPIDFEHDGGSPIRDYRFIVNEGSSSTTFDTTGPSIGIGIPSAGFAPGLAMLWNNGNFTTDVNGTHLYWVEKVDGTRIDFSTLGKRCGEDDRRCAVAETVTRPNGTRYELTYISVAVSSGVTKDVVETVTSNRGYGLKFFYNLSVGDQPIKACLFNTATNPMSTGQSCNSAGSTEVTYTVDSLSFEANTAVGRSERIVSTATTGVREISFYNGHDTAPWVINSVMNSVDAVSFQAFADGQTYRYQFDAIRNPSPTPSAAGGNYTDSRDGIVQVQFPQIPYPTDYSAPCADRSCASPLQVASGPSAIVDQLGRVSSADYCDPWIPPPGYQYIPGGATGNLRGCVYGKIQSVTDAEGRTTKFRYGNNRMVVERRRNSKPGSGLSAIVETVEFDCTQYLCKHKPTAATDGNGNTTNWEYSTVHGALLRETLPADASGIRPETRYTYQQKYAWLKSGSGYVQATTPIWLLASQYTCRTSAMQSNGNCAAGATDKVVTTYQYEAGNASTPSNLHMLGIAVTADGQTLRTCYGYDDQGRRISETQPKAGRATCPS